MLNTDLAFAQKVANNDVLVNALEIDKKSTPTLAMRQAITIPIPFNFEVNSFK